MKWLRLLGLGALLWIIIFIEISITMIGLGLSNLTTYIIHYILLIPITLFCAWLYYKSGDKTNGFLIGLLLVITGIILDMIITIPLFIMPEGGSYASYFSNLYLIAGFIEVIAIAGIYDFLKKK